MRLILMVLATFGQMAHPPECAELEMDLVAMTSSAAAWHDAANDYRKAAILWRGRSLEKDLTIKYLRTDLAESEAREEHAASLLTERPSPEVITETPTWIPFALAGAVALGAGVAIAVAHFAGVP